MTRVMSACSASTCRSNISFACSSQSAGTPIGPIERARQRVARSAARPSECAARPRAPNRDTGSPARSDRPARASAAGGPCRRVTQSRMLRFSPQLRLAVGRRCRRRRTAVRTPRAGLASVGSGVVGRRPGERVHVDAGVAVVAVADHVVEIGGELQRRQRRVLAELLRGDLIDGGAQLVVGAFGQLRPGRRSGTCSWRSRGCRTSRRSSARGSKRPSPDRGTASATPASATARSACPPPPASTSADVDPIGM